MKKISISLMTLSIASLLSMNSCRNKEDVTDLLTDADMTSASTQALDNDNVTSDLDDAMDKVNTDLASGNSSARLEASITCGYTANYANYNATLSGTGDKTIVYSFTGVACDGRTRTGTITAKLISGDFFKDKGAQYQLIFAGYAVTSAGETVTLEGTQTVTNVTGGLPRFVLTKPDSFTTVTHDVTGTMQLTFSTSGTTRTWNINREISWTKSELGVLATSISSSYSKDGYSNVSVYGENRLGNNFYTQIINPITANASCGWFRPTGGERKHTLLDAEGVVNLTSDAQINVGSDGCATGFTITTTNKRGKVRTISVTY